jgi:hypothetical protein
MCKGMAIFAICKGKMPKSKRGFPKNAFRLPPLAMLTGRPFTYANTIIARCAMHRAIFKYAGKYYSS